MRIDTTFLLDGDDRVDCELWRRASRLAGSADLLQLLAATGLLAPVNCRRHSDVCSSSCKQPAVLIRLFAAQNSATIRSRSLTV